MGSGDEAGRVASISATTKGLKCAAHGRGAATEDRPYIYSQIVIGRVSVVSLRTPGEVLNPLPFSSSDSRCIDLEAQ